MKESGQLIDDELTIDEVWSHLSSLSLQKRRDSITSAWTAALSSNSKQTNGDFHGENATWFYKISSHRVTPSWLQRHQGEGCATIDVSLIDSRSGRAPETSFPETCLTVGVEELARMYTDLSSITFYGEKAERQYKCSERVPLDNKSGLQSRNASRPSVFTVHKEPQAGVCK